MTLFDLILARSFTASDSAGTAATLTGNNAKRRTSFGTSLVTDLRASSTATLTAGTRTLDTHAIGFARGFVPATVVNYAFVGNNVMNLAGASTFAYTGEYLDLYRLNHTNEWPVVFVQNEGFLVRATVPATGTWTFSVIIEWLEVAATGGFN